MSKFKKINKSMKYYNNEQEDTLVSYTCIFKSHILLMNTKAKNLP